MTARVANGVRRKRSGNGSSSIQAHPRIALSREALRRQGRSHLPFLGYHISELVVRMHAHGEIVHEFAADRVGRKCRLLFRNSKKVRFRNSCQDLVGAGSRQSQTTARYAYLQQDSPKAKASNQLGIPLHQGSWNFSCWSRQQECHLLLGTGQSGSGLHIFTPLHSKSSSRILSRQSVAFFRLPHVKPRTPRKSASLRSAPRKSTRDRSAYFNFAPSRSVHNISAPRKFTCRKSVPDNTALTKFAPERSACCKFEPCKSAFSKFARTRTAFLKFETEKMHYVSPLS